MNILYVCHNTYLVEQSGIPLMVDRYAKQCLKIGYKVGILTPSESKINYKLNKKKESEINYYNWPSLKNWNIEAFSDQIYNNFSERIIFDFKPDIIHILDWINIRPDFFNFIKKLKVPVIKHVLNFEDFCSLTSPIYKNSNGMPCKSPLSAETCAECVVKYKYKKKKFFKKTFAYLTGSKKKEIIYIKEKLINRLKKVNYINQNYFNHLIFPSNSFAKFYFSHSKKKILNKSIIGIGIKKKENSKKAFYTNNKLNIIFLAGGSFKKGWDFVETAFSKILKDNDKINLRIYGFKNKTSKSKLNRFKSVEFYDSYLEKDLPKILNWADLGLLPSLFEGYCITLREFIEYNVIPIITKFMGSNIIKNNYNGIILKQPYSKNIENIIQKLSSNVLEIQRYKKNLNKTKVLYEKDEFHKILNIYKKLKKKNITN